MKKFLVILLSVSVLFSCVDYEDRFQDIEDRLTLLEKMCERMNAEIASIKKIVDAMEENSYVTSVEPIMAGDEEIGYVLYFSNGRPVRIYHGEDGEKGDAGVDGKDGHTPVIGAKQFSEDGKYYWTVDGEWLLDRLGHKMPVEGEDALTPFFKIEDGYWYLSYDNINWERLGKATGEDGDSFFEDVEVTENNIKVTLKDGTIFDIPRYQPIGISFNIENAEAGAVPGQDIEIEYTLTNATENTVITASSDGRYLVSMSRNSISDGKIIVTCPEVYHDGYINVMVSDNGFSSIKVVNFYESKILFPEGLEYSVDVEGGDVTIPLSFNFDFNAVVSEESSSWISLIQKTKAPDMKDDVLNIHVEANTVPKPRSGKILIYSLLNKNVPYCEILISQTARDLPEESYMIFSAVANSENNFTAYLPLWGDIDCTIDWGDGNEEAFKQNNTISSYEFISHKYETKEEKSYSVKIYGKITALSSSSADESVNIPAHSVTEIVQWGETGLLSIDRAFMNNSILKNINAPSLNSFRNLKTIRFAFSGCESLTSVPEDMFYNCPQVTDFDNVFSYCLALESISASLFSKSVNAASFNGTFQECSSLSAIPEGLFDNCNAVNNFSNTFNGCTSLMTLPDKLFAKCINVKNFSGVFQQCTSLAIIPVGLFDNCHQVTDFSSAFNFCLNLKSIPSGLFNNCTKVVSFRKTFGGCANLKGESPYTILNDVKCHLYERKNHSESFVNPKGDGCFANCSSLSDYKEIPDNWK